jgi:hypothetical protein
VAFSGGEPGAGSAGRADLPSAPRAALTDRTPSPAFPSPQQPRRENKSLENRREGRRILKNNIHIKVFWKFAENYV